MILKLHIGLFSLKIDEQNISKSHFLFLVNFSSNMVPKFDEKETQNGLSDLGKFTLRACWLLRAWFLVPKKPSKALKRLTGTSLAGNLDLICKLTDSISLSFDEHIRLSNQMFPIRLRKLAVDILYLTTHPCNLRSPKWTWSGITSNASELVAL